jgi:hypothetical protein
MDRSWPRWLLAGSMALCIYILATAKVLPHSWYDPECCSDRDCAPMTYVPKPLPGGAYLLDTGEVVDRSKVKWSRDEHYHLCRNPGGGHIFCLYVPPQGS